MPVHLQREIESLKKKLLSVGSLVEENLWRAVKSIADRDVELAEQAAQADLEIDALEVEVEEDCLKVLALHQPVAIDLRFIVAVLKINNDLERIGDLAVNVAKRARSISALGDYDTGLDFGEMAGAVQKMVRTSLDSLVNLDAGLAEDVCAADDEVDAMHRENYRRVKRTLREDPERFDVLLHMVSVSYHLERIADHATNIAEDVVYMVEGRIIRHPGDGAADG